MIIPSHYHVTGRQITIKIGQNLAISNPEPDLHNINAHIKFGENPLRFTDFIVQKQKYEHAWTLSKQELSEDNAARQKGLIG